MSSMMNIGSQTSEIIIRECTRKKPYPTEAMAKNAATTSTRAATDGTQYRHYKCKHGNHWHIGRDKFASPSPEAVYLERDGVLLGKVWIQNQQWIFMLPLGTKENEHEILDQGILIAKSNNRGRFFTKDDLNSEHDLLFRGLKSVYVKNAKAFIQRVEAMPIEFYADALNTFQERYNMLRTDNQLVTSKRIIIPMKRQEEVEAISKQEMYKNRAVFRTPDNKPFFRDIVTCCNKGCDNKIELRAFISTGKDGSLANIYGKVPLGGKAIKKEGSLRDWICKDCVNGGHVEVVDDLEQPIAEKQAAALPVVKADMRILADLKRIALNKEVPAEFVRGATLMACTILEA